MGLTGVFSQALFGSFDQRGEIFQRTRQFQKWMLKINKKNNKLILISVVSLIENKFFATRITYFK